MRRSRRDLDLWRWAFSGVVGLLALGGLGVGCTWGGAPSSLLIHVVNKSSLDGTFHWEGAGASSSGTEPIGRCLDYVRGFAPGDAKITITSGDHTLTVNVTAPTTGQEAHWYLIGSDGTIQPTIDTQLPSSPFCVPTPYPGAT